MQEIDKKRVELLINKGFDFHQQGLLDDAEPLYTEALKLDENNAEAYNLIGVLKLQQGDADEAIEYSKKAISISPESYFYETLFQSLIRKENFKAITEYEDTINSQFPESYELMFDLALAFKKIHENKKALKYYEKSLKINPASYEGWYNIANIYNMEGREKEAISAMNICRKIRPEESDTAYFLGLDYLKAGEYNKGLPLFEHRISKKFAIESLKKTNPATIRDDNEWKGNNVKEKSILIYTEAGFGDTIMFARYLPLVANKCKKLTFMCQKNLSKLFEQNKQHLGIDNIIASYIPDSNIDADFHASLLSLPYILKLKGNDIFQSSEGYIVPDMNMVEEYHTKYFDTERIKVGIKWHGNTSFDTDRVVPAECFNRLIDLNNAQYYSFQTFEGAEEVKKLHNIIDIGKDLTDFSQTAAALRNLDLVICNDTSLAHLAGAMRIPCWIMLPYDVNWRWGTDLSKCKWYQSVKMFRQQSIGDWQSVFDNIIKEMTTD